MLRRLFDWLSQEDTKVLILAIAGLVAILRAAIVAAKATWPLTCRAFRKSGHALKVAWSWLGVRSKVACARLRWTVMFGGQKALVERARCSLEKLGDSNSRSEVAQALAFAGRVDSATSLDMGGAVWGLAVGYGLKEALSIAEPRKHVDIGAYTAWEGLVKLSNDLDSKKSEYEWRRSKAMTVPIAALADELDEAGKPPKWPSCLEDLSRYLQSARIVGFSRVRDTNILRPIGKRRLRALRWISVRTAPCSSLPIIAASLSMLVGAEAKFRKGGPA